MIHLKDIPTVNVPLYDELAIKKVLARVIKLPSVSVFLPKAVVEKNAPINRDFLFSVLATKEPELLNDLIYNAHKQRNVREGEEAEMENIEITQNMMNML